VHQLFGSGAIQRPVDLHHIGTDTATTQVMEPGRRNVFDRICGLLPDLQRIQRLLHDAGVAVSGAVVAILDDESIDALQPLETGQVEDLTAKWPTQLHRPDKAASNVRCNACPRGQSRL
jgi:hypothetical protein